MPSGLALSLTCRVHTEPDGDDHTIPYTLRFTAVAPRSVAGDEEFGVVLAPEPITFSPRLSSGIGDITLRFAAPTGARVVGYALTGGDGSAAGTRVEPTADGVVLRAPGPFGPGTPFTLPALRWTLRADGSGAVVRTGLAGSSFDDPAWSYRWARRSDGRRGTVTGYPDRSPVLTLTRPAGPRS
ncbi:hypothetical protein [Streptomyces sp. UNOC14_S4]|uniref:hypothetical protein n=1 Tax=Streptomyces sp. UNOC14_S4 TaxID=2872340 RepID=UPI001E38A667|nr:hypothetical protein [Streptomyces sp. UNOC14_S4]MCC3767126.1 hypothetical protein [Streptomyces sp. UNOC14_S4]